MSVEEVAAHFRTRTWTRYPPVTDVTRDRMPDPPDSIARLTAEYFARRIDKETYFILKDAARQGKHVVLHNPDDDE